MSEARPGPPASVPTLTEVIETPGEAPVREIAAPVATAAATVPAPALAAGPSSVVPGAPLAAPQPALPSEDELTRRILDEVQRQVDLVVEYRIREVLTPILERTGDALVREARAELARALREVVARCVASELRRQRPG
jgi:hypothetical protein